MIRKFFRKVFHRTAPSSAVVNEPALLGPAHHNITRKGFSPAALFVCDTLQDHGYDAFIVGGAAYLVSKAIKTAKVVGFEDLGMEAIYEFDVTDMPVTVAVDASGTSVHNTGPREWQVKIGKIPLATA